MLKAAKQMEEKYRVSGCKVTTHLIACPCRGSLELRSLRLALWMTSMNKGPVSVIALTVINLVVNGRAAAKKMTKLDFMASLLSYSV